MEVLPSEVEIQGPSLPPAAEVLGDDEDWHPRTVAWWEGIRSNPLMSQGLDMDWDFLIDTALMHHTMWARQRLDLASEIRLRVAKYGATPEDRMRLKVKVEKPALPAPASTSAGSSKPSNVTSLSDRRKRLA